MQIVSRKTQLALQALAWLYQRPEEVCNVRQIAESIAVSVTSLTKVMQALGRAGYVTGERGVGGGYRMNEIPEKESLYDIALHMGEYERLHDTCFLGVAVCASENPCAAHPHWEKHKESLIDFLKGTSLGKVIKEGDKKSLISEPLSD